MIRRWSHQTGLTIAEVLLGLLFLSIVATGITSSLMSSDVIMHRTSRRSVAEQIALDTLEKYARINPELFTSANNISNETVTKDNINYKRSVEFVLNADRSRAVNVTISYKSAHSKPTAQSDFVIKQTAVFALWGER